MSGDYRASRISLLLDKNEQTYLDSRISDIEKAASRARWIYGAASILSLMLISVAYNEYFSWAREMADSLAAETDKSAWPNKLRTFLMREWVSSLQFDVPYVGGKFGASDAGIIGGLMLLLASIWCVHAAARENYLIFYLIKDAKEFYFPENAKFYLRNQIISTQLFSESSTEALDDQDLERLDTASSAKKASLASHIEIESAGSLAKKKTNGKVHFAKYLMSSLIFLMPAISLAFVFIVDISSLTSPSPFRSPDNQTLYAAICKNSDKFYGIYKFWTCKHDTLVLRLFISFTLMSAVVLVMLKALRYQVATNRLVHYVLENWRGPLSALRNTQ